MERLFADLPFPVDLLDLAARSIRFPEDADLFFGRVSILPFIFWVLCRHPD